MRRTMIFSILFLSLEALASFKATYELKEILPDGREKRTAFFFSKKGFSKSTFLFPKGKGKVYMTTTGGSYSIDGNTLTLQFEKSFCNPSEYTEKVTFDKNTMTLNGIKFKAVDSVDFDEDQKLDQDPLCGMLE